MYTRYKYDFIRNVEERQYLENGDWAVTNCELWDWLKTADLKECGTENLMRIAKKMAEQDIGANHSGSTFTYVIRKLQYAVRYGYTQFHDNYYIDGCPV